MIEIEYDPFCRGINDLGSSRKFEWSPHGTVMVVSIGWDYTHQHVSGPMCNFGNFPGMSARQGISAIKGLLHSATHMVKII